MSSSFSGRYNANSYAYGIASSLSTSPNPLVVNSGNAAAGSFSIQLQYGVVFTPDGKPFEPPSVNAPILIGSGSNQETVTPSAVSNPSPGIYGSPVITATFANAHGIGDLIASGTFGLQEAANVAAAAGGGIVVVDAAWTAKGGTQAMISAAVLATGVTIEDLRQGDAGEDVRYVTGTIANAQVLTLNSVGVALAPALGAGIAMEVVSCLLENVFKTGAYANGGVIGIAYGLAGTAASTTVAATFLTSPTANQSVLLTGVLASALSSAAVNKPLTLQAATADFITGAGSLNYRLTYRVHTGL